MMAADDTYTGVEVVAELSGATTPTNGFQARARHERPPVKVGGAGSAAVSQLLSMDCYGRGGDRLTTET